MGICLSTSRTLERRLGSDPKTRIGQLAQLVEATRGLSTWPRSLAEARSRPGCGPERPGCGREEAGRRPGEVGSEAGRRPGRLTRLSFRWFTVRVLSYQKQFFALPSAVGAALAIALVGTPAWAQGTDDGDDHQPRTRLSGYMDFHYNKLESADGRLDFHRFVLLVTHEFSPRIRFVGELELEHAFVEGLEEGGELELEQAYVDFLLSRGFNVRAGMLLMPVGILNERHEPPVYYGVERTFVDTVIVPTTWFEVGAGIHGEVGRGWRYRLFVTSPLNAARVQRRRRDPRRTPEGQRDQHRPRRAHRPRRVRRPPRPHHRRQLLDRQVRLRAASALRRAGAPDRGGRPLHARSPGAARPDRRRHHRQRRRS